MNERQRLEKVISEEGMTAKQFAQEVGIQAGTVSNIMSGRNNPSLDVMQRVLNRFRTLSSDWLILGVGSMYRQNGESPENTLFDLRPHTREEELPLEEPFTEITPAKKVCQESPTISKIVSKIVIFYSDGTFEER